MKQRELEACRERLDEHLATVLYPTCERSQQRKWGSVYARGLLLEGGRKSAGAMAERLPDGNEQSMQQFISQSTWNFRAVRQRLAELVVAQLPKQGLWVFDDTGFPKCGKHSVGVARQYSGTLGKIGNCQIGVSMHYATPQGSMPLDFELYLPEVWINDPDRCRKAGVPANTSFQTKWEMALTMLDRVRTWGLADQVVTTDAGYGKVCEFRDGLTERGLLYIVGVDEATGVWIPPMSVSLLPRTSNRGRAPTRYDYGDQEPPSVLQVAQGLPPEAWETIAWDQGSRGPLRSRFAALRVHPSKGYHEGKPLRPLEWLLIEWPEGQDKPEHYWLSTLPESTPLVDLVRQAKWRWHIEQDYQQLKDELGLDHFEGRSWVGWHRHVTMTMVAFGFLVLERLRDAKKGAHPRSLA
jgi:SRSO17 transposase